MPGPRDVLSMGARNLQGKQLSRFVTSYEKAIVALRDKPEDMSQILGSFREQLDLMAGHSQVRRHALGSKLPEGTEGPYVGHVGIPDEYVVIGDQAWKGLAGIGKKDLQHLSSRSRMSRSTLLAHGIHSLTQSASLRRYCAPSRQRWQRRCGAWTLKTRAELCCF